MHRQIGQLAQSRVLVVGDLILDRYWHGATRRISPEAPVPVVLVDETVERVGGAANVAANISALGAKVVLVGVVGEDEAGDTLAELCRGAGIETDFLRSKSHCTIVKLRVVSQRQQLVRLDFEAPMVGAFDTDLVGYVERHLADCDIVVVSDYAKGAASRVEEIIASAVAAGKRIIIDPKGDAFARYTGATLLTPNLQEFETVVGVCADDDEIIEKARQLTAQLKLEAILVTRGGAGMTLVMANGAHVHVAAHTHEVFDVTGAGDTVCGVLAAALASGDDMPNAVTLANVAAGLVVGKFGAATVNVAELEAALVDRSVVRRGEMSRVELIEECTKARRRGERIVMTNGCFDILHAGHVRYLNEAKALGNRLIVAVNDDASVAKLKGAGRPLNRLSDRMQILAALAAVDWVVGFSEDTPQKLIAEILPDTLVKGGDYDVMAIAGGDDVRAAGGQVIAVDFHEGFSTSDLIGKMTPTSEPNS